MLRAGLFCFAGSKRWWNSLTYCRPWTAKDVSTNGTYLNGKRLPRPPYKNPSEARHDKRDRSLTCQQSSEDARVRLFHGDELLFKRLPQGPVG